MMVILREPRLNLLPRLSSKILLPLVYPKSTKYICVTSDAYNKLKKQHKKTVYVPMPIDTNHFAKKTYAKKSTLNLLCVSKFEKRKRLPLLLNSLKDIVDKDYKIKLRILVPFSSYYESHREQTLSLVKNLGLEKHVEFMYNVPINEMPSHYEWADLFVFPAVNEPLGYSLVEAMAAGLPSICSDDIGAGDYLEQGVSGYVFKRDSKKELTNNILKFFKGKTIDSKKLAQFGGAARERISSNNLPKFFYDAIMRLSKE